MIGYMTKADALRHGFTHHGRMYGVPIWIAEPHSEGPMVAAKFVPFEMWLSFGTFVVQFMHMIDEDLPGFPIIVGRRIEQ